MELDKAGDKFDRAAAVLPPRLRQAALKLPLRCRAEAEELRLHAGRTMTVLGAAGELDTAAAVTPEDLEAVCDLAADYSRYAALETLRWGYLPLQGGGRVGLCGTAVIKAGECTNLRDLSSLAIRIAREKQGIGQTLAPKLFREGRFCSTLLLSPPGGGKTTLLRDLIRCLSYGIGIGQPLRVALADERGEVAALWRGMPQMDVGPRTDVLDGCPKGQAMLMLLRCMNPQIIAADEITAPEDLRAMEQAANCGVGLLATIHAADVGELSRRPLCARLLEGRMFRLAIRIERCAQERRYEVEELPC